MRALIVEDEAMARRNLIRMLSENFPDIEVVGYTSSILETVAWLQANTCDVIFMDVELSDGNCFEIFRQVNIQSKVVMTTAYDSYAIKAFEVNSIDYLLKPIELTALQRAVERCRNASQKTDVAKVLEALSKPKEETAHYKERFLVRFNDRIVPVDTKSVAYFFSKNKYTCLMTFEGQEYVLNPSLDDIENELDPKEFFRVSRSFIIAKRSVQSITKILGGRLKITATPPSEEGIEVSRARVDDFLEWLEK